MVLGVVTSCRRQHQHGFFVRQMLRESEDEEVVISHRVDADFLRALEVSIVRHWCWTQPDVEFADV